MFLWLVSIVFLLISSSSLKSETFLQSFSFFQPDGLFPIFNLGTLKCSKFSPFCQQTIIATFLIEQKGSEEMASSQVEIASSSSPFGHVLRDRNRRDRCSHRDSTNAAFQKNLKDLVHTHIHSCISTSQPTPSSADSHGPAHVDYADLWVHKPQWDNNENSPTTNISSTINNNNKWDRAREMAFSSRSTKQREANTSPEGSAVEVPNNGGVSTLVRRWRDFETVSKSVNLGNNSPQKGCDETCDEPSVDGRFETPAMSVNGESSGDWEPMDKTTVMNERNLDVKEREKPRVVMNERNLDIKEREKPRVADIIRKLASSNGEENQESEHNGNNPALACSGESLPRIRTSFDHSEQQLQQQQQQRSFFPVLHSPRIIRGRQALSDLLLQMERDRYQELEGFKERKAVSKFQQRGRIQALLKVRFLRCGTGARDDQSTKGTSSESNRMSQSAITHIRKRFNTGSQNGEAEARSLSREAAYNTHESQNFTQNQQRVQNSERGDKGSISCHRELADNNTVKVGSELALHARRERNQQGMQPGVADSRSTSIAVENNSPKSESASTSARENHSQEPSEPISLCTKVVDNNSQVGKVFPFNQLREENISPQRITTNVKVTSSSNPQKEMPFHTRDSDSSFSPNHNEVDRSHQTLSSKLLHYNSQLRSSDISHDQASWENASCEASHDKSPEFLDTPRPPKYSEQTVHGLSVHREEQDANNLQHAGTSNEWSSESTKRQSDWEEEATNQNLVDSDCGWVSDYSYTPSGWDELQSNYEQQSESNQDWVSDISRPRKEWEGLRQARYQEMLDPFQDNNHDIRQLLNRKSVSIFLNSGLREKIDRLMASRSQLPPNAMSGQLQEEVEAPVPKEKEKEEEVVSHNETQGGEAEDDEEEEDSGYEDDFEDDNTPIRQHYLEPEKLVYQKKASHTLLSWSNNQDRGASDVSYHLPSNSLPQSQSSNIYSHHNQQCSSTIHTSIEMELIYELRGHMEQLHQEIFEIRRSINSCVNMQMKLQHSIKQEVAAAITQSGPMIGNNSDKGANRANCRICYEAQVDSLLYRCGHMCTCFRCAHELLWSTGKCPICETPIIDVVRAYIHS